MESRAHSSKSYISIHIGSLYPFCFTIGLMFPMCIHFMYFFKVHERKQTYLFPLTFRISLGTSVHITILLFKNINASYAAVFLTA